MIVADDLGYGDLSSYGAPLIRTPHLDRLAAEGTRLTQCYVPSPLCTPSRGSLLTGLYPPRTGLVGNLPSGPPVDGGAPGGRGEGTGGIDDGEVTLAEALRELGYATAMVGKWHLGHLARYLPIHHGFDSYYGIPSGADPGLLVRGDRLAPPVDLDQITRTYTEEAVRFVRAPRERPFFLYLAHRAPHVPLATAAEFVGRSAGGRYGDTVEELDWSVGEVLAAVRESGGERDTLVFFTSDNGPWLAQGAEGGSAAPLFGGKGSPWEGGVRVPCIAWGPGRVAAGRVVSEPSSTLDLFPTLLALAGGALPAGRPYDGQDIQQLLAAKTTRLPGPGQDGGRELMSWVGSNPAALRSGRWKYVAPGVWSPVAALFDIEADPGEAHDLILARPDLSRALADRVGALADQVRSGAPQPKK